MKTVFNNSQVAHVWAQQNQPEGRNGKKTLFFEGPTLYSYGRHFWIGHFIKPEVVFINSDHYSTTTSQHQGEAQEAVRHHTVFNVPSRDNHGENIEHYLNLIEKYLSSAERAPRTASLTSLENATYSILSAQIEFASFRDYCLQFKIKIDFDWPEKRIEEIRAKKQANDEKWNTPEAVANREKARVKREKEKRMKEIFSVRKNVKDFLTKKFYSCGRSHLFPTLLRIDGDTIRTSRGAEMPVKFARHIWEMVAKCKASQSTYEPNGKTLHAGHFQVDRIDHTGDLKAGCHYIKFGVLKNMARQLDFI